MSLSTEGQQARAARRATLPAGDVGLIDFIPPVDPDERRQLEFIVKHLTASPTLRAFLQTLQANVNLTTDVGRSLAQAEAAEDAQAAISLTPGTDVPTQEALDTLTASLGDLATADTVTAAQISDASANGRSLITAANYAAMRALLDLEAGTDFNAFDATLASLAAVNVAANDVFFYVTANSGGNATTIATATVTSFARSFLDDANAGAALTTLGVGAVGGQLFAATTFGGARTITLGGVETLNSDANSNFAPAGAVGMAFKTIETTTLTANRNRNLATTGAVAGDIYEYRRTSADAFGRQIRDSTGTNLGAAVPVNITARFLFNGTDWINWGRSAS